MNAHQKFFYKRGFEQGHKEGERAAIHGRPYRPVAGRRQTMDYQRGFHNGYNEGYEGR